MFIIDWNGTARHDSTLSSAKIIPLMGCPEYASPIPVKARDIINDINGLESFSVPDRIIFFAKLHLRHALFYCSVPCEDYINSLLRSNRIYITRILVDLNGKGFIV